MCPSFKVLREEKHTTRGRARLLFEMLEGDVITDGWRSREVKDALDLCLACKGCTNDCPVNVDMPDLQGRVPPPPLEAARCGPGTPTRSGSSTRRRGSPSQVPRLANFVTHAPGLARALVRRPAGVVAARGRSRRSRR